MVVSLTSGGATTCLSYYTDQCYMQHALLLILKNRWCISFSKLAIIFVLSIIVFNVSVPIYSSLPYFRSSFQILVNLFLFSIYITYLSWTFSNQQSNNLLGCFVLSSFLIYDTTGSTSGAGSTYPSEAPVFIPSFWWSSCYSIFNFMLNVLKIVVCPFVPFLFLSFCDLRILITPLVSSNSS